MKRRFPQVFVLVLAAGIGLFYYNRYRVAPDLKEKNVVFFKNGVSTSLEDDLEGDVAVVFYASWCGPCMAELADLVQLHPEFQSKGLRILALTDDTTDKLEHVRNRLHVPFEMYRLEGTLKSYGIFTIPTAYVFDQSGRLVYEHVDKMDWKDPAFLNALFQDLN